MDIQSGKAAKAFICLTIASEITVIAGAALWVTGWKGANILFIIGAIVFAVLRLAEKNKGKDIIEKRLYRQRKAGAIALLMAALLMIVCPCYFLGYYLLPSTWLIPFVIFTVFEVYTAFRIK